MSDQTSDDRKSGAKPAEVVTLARVRDRVERQKQDREAAALAGRFHDAMGWKGKPDKPGGKKARRKKK